MIMYRVNIGSPKILLQNTKMDVYTYNNVQNVMDGKNMSTTRLIIRQNHAHLVRDVLKEKLVLTSII